VFGAADGFGWWRSACSVLRLSSAVLPDRRSRRQSLDRARGTATLYPASGIMILQAHKQAHKNVHNRFKLNGYHLTKEDLCRIAYSFIKEGEDFEQAVGDFLLDWFDDKSYIDMYTSGTTGEPKTIRIEKNAMVQSAISTGDFSPRRSRVEPYPPRGTCPTKSFRPPAKKSPRNSLS